MKNHTLTEDSFDVRRTRSQTSRPSPVLPLIAATLFAIHPVQGQAPQITAPPRSQTISAGSNLILGAATTGGNLSYQWRVNGANIPGQTNALLFLPQPTTNNSGSYTLVVTNAAGAITSSVANVTINPLSAPRAVVVWGAGSQGQSGPSDFGQRILPDNLNSVVSLAAGTHHTLALKSDGTAAGWGYNLLGQSTVPAGLGGLVAVAGGYQHSMVLKNDGTIVPWGAGFATGGGGNGLSFGQSLVPAGLTGVVAISAGIYHSAALKNDGTVIVWGAGTTTSGDLGIEFGQSIVPEGLSGVVGISAGYYHNLALKSDGTVVAWGAGTTTGTAAEFGQSLVPAGLNGIVTVTGGGYHSLALKSDGTVIAWGSNSDGQTNVPPGLSGVVAIAASGFHSMALKQDSTLVVWGGNSDGQTNVPTGLTGVLAIAAGHAHSVALMAGPPAIRTQPASLTVAHNSDATFSVDAVGPEPLGYQWRSNSLPIANATDSSLTLANAQSTFSANYSVVITNAYGSITSSVAALSVFSPPSINVQPQSQTVLAGTNVTFSVAATGLSLTPEGWQAKSNIGAPAGRIFYHANTAVWTGSKMIVWGGTTGANQATVLDDGAAYDLAADTWTALPSTDAPSARFDFTTVWTGSEMIVWGGGSGGPNSMFNTGARYNPLLNIWTPISTNGAPSARQSHTAVWTGTEMIIWGGYFYDGTFHYLNDGARYNPETDTWTAVTGPGVPDARALHTTIWTGAEMIVWGGIDASSTLNDGARYNPVSNTWTQVQSSGAPSARFDHISAVWTGSEMIIWGGQPFSNSGGRYHPSSNTWTQISTTGAPTARVFDSAIWTGTEMIIWGGGITPGTVAVNDGARYNPAAGTWTPVTLTGAPGPRSVHAAVWTGTQMLIWGGSSNANYSLPNGYLNDTFSYTPGTTPLFYQWSANGIAIVGATNATLTLSNVQSSHVANYSVVVSNLFGSVTSADASLMVAAPPTIAIQPQSQVAASGRNVTFSLTASAPPFAPDAWQARSNTAAPSARSTHAAVWTGTELIIWGGNNGVTALNDGARYNPMTDTWVPMATDGSPSGRENFTAIWTGTEMIVWGGDGAAGNGSILAGGARYNPASDKWTTVSTTDAPSARANHTAVWTGTEMIIWGGHNGGIGAGIPLNDGVRYNPVTDTWTAINTVAAPSGRAAHTAVWTGNDMIVWGGINGVSGHLRGRLAMVRATVRILMRGLRSPTVVFWAAATITRLSGPAPK